MKYISQLKDGTIFVVFINSIIQNYKSADIGCCCENMKAPVKMFLF